jgi:hypothetical protein
MQTAVLISALFATAVSSRNCKPGLFYCGSTLISIGKRNKNQSGSLNIYVLTDQSRCTGNYGGQIDQAMYAAGKPFVDASKTLFYCVGGDNGVIAYVNTCGVCQDNGADRSDKCA